MRSARRDHLIMLRVGPILEADPIDGPRRVQAIRGYITRDLIDTGSGRFACAGRSGEVGTTSPRLRARVGTSMWAISSSACSAVSLASDSAVRRPCPRRARVPFPAGHCVNLGAFRERVWTPALAAAGISYRKPYSLRHTFATLLLAQGQSIPCVSAQLGHSSPTITLNVYAKFLPQERRESPAKFEAQLHAARGNPAVSLNDGVHDASRREQALEKAEVGSPRPATAPWASSPGWPGSARGSRCPRRATAARPWSWCRRDPTPFWP